MRKKDVIHALRHVDEKSAMQLGEDYLDFTAKEDARMLRKIEEQLQMQTFPEDIAQDEPLPVVQESRFAWVHHAAVAAACVLVFGGTFAGLFRMMQLSPPPGETTESTSADAVPVYGIGSRYAAGNLTQSGTLYLTVEGTEIIHAEDGSRVQVTVFLESKHAVSVVGTQIFYAENLMLAHGLDAYGQWDAVQPCAVSEQEHAEGYAFTLSSGKSKELHLEYRISDAAAQPLYLVTSYSTAYPYTELNLQEEPS